MPVEILAEGDFMPFLPVFLFFYVCVIKLAGFVLMGLDKRKAKKHLWRIPEKTLFLIAALGGSLGVLAGMYLFRHKTKHKSFVFGVPLILAAQIALAWLLVTNLG